MPVVWTIRVGSTRSTTFSPRTHSRGTKWIPRFQNTRSIRRDKTGDMPLSCRARFPLTGYAHLPLGPLGPPAYPRLSCLVLLVKAQAPSPIFSPLVRRFSVLPSFGFLELRIDASDSVRSCPG